MKPIKLEDIEGTLPLTICTSSLEMLVKDTVLLILAFVGFWIPKDKMTLIGMW